MNVVPSTQERAIAGTTSTLASLRPPRQSGSRGTRRSAGSSRGQHFEAIRHRPETNDCDRLI